MAEDEKRGASQILTLLDSLADTDSGINCKDFTSLIKESLEEDINPTDFHKLLNFISAQCGFWDANWYFSEATSPNLTAKAESEQWENLWQASVTALTESFSAPEEQLHHEHNLIVLEESLQRRVKFNDSSRIERYLTSVFGYISIRLNKIGFKSIAHNIYTKSLYPKGTVGRIR